MSGATAGAPAKVCWTLPEVGALLAKTGARSGAKGGALAKAAWTLTGAGGLLVEAVVESDGTLAKAGGALAEGFLPKTF